MPQISRRLVSLTVCLLLSTYAIFDPLNAAQEPIPDTTCEHERSFLEEVKHECNEYEQQWQSIVLREIELHEHEVVKYRDLDKIYIIPHRVTTTEMGIYLNTHGKELLYIPCLRSDCNGCYIKKFDQPISYWDPPKGLNPDEMKKKEKDRVKENKERYEREKENTKKEAELRRKQREERKKNN